MPHAPAHSCAIPTRSQRLGLPLDQNRSPARSQKQGWLGAAEMQWEIVITQTTTDHHRTPCKWPAFRSSRTRPPPSASTDAILHTRTEGSATARK
ncbi:uncharacterized protein BKCO1_2100030 [Diplodia corticola]|uniref:Uncharacterized protein n=1 Tax=Diplodia corticola TaxID=236234 RepID=A0A1J9R236_9PEZI|nr:uncharacterized protein BKCO1_2100030 [Diplodia corticola]OJD34649.1 hypothetical protein BKCO1_2100030 [Diplodia corticola]